MSWLLSNPTKPYIDAAKTDVMRTWRKHGFIPPSETKADFGSCLDMLNELTIRKPADAMENLQQVQDK